MRNAWTRGSMLVALLAALSPLPSLAQSQPVGVVTTLTGQATLARTALPQPLILKFKDDVFERDRISTAEKSIVRVLLGGKAIVTIRELSVLTITEEPGRATIDLASGKIGVAVAKQRMRPGESLEIRTPNAVAAVRGTVIAVETELVGSIQKTEYDVQSGTLELLAPRPETLTDGRGITVNGLAAGVPRPARPDAFTAGFQREPGAGGASSDAATASSIENGLSQAGALALAISPAPPIPIPNPAGSTGAVQQAPINGTTGKSSQEIKDSSGSPPGTGGPIPQPGNGGGTPPPKVGAVEKVLNGGFETNSLPPNWNLAGGGGIITNLGSITPPEGQRMALIHTGEGALMVAANPNLLPTPPANAIQGSRLTQSFDVVGSSLFTIRLNYNFVSNEFPSQSVDDVFRVRITGPSGVTSQLAFESRLTSTFQTSSELATALGFTALSAQSSHGTTGFKLVNAQWVPEGSGVATLSFEIFDRSDTLFDSAGLVDAVSVMQDPPLFFLRRGDALTRTRTEPILRLNAATQAFDSLLVVCCEGRATLAGPLLHATDSNLTVPWSLLTVLQGGVVTTSSTEPLVRLDAGFHSFGSAGVPMFDLSGLHATLDPDTGLTLGTDRPLQHAGPLLEASNATVSAHQAARIDSALLEATAPLLALRNGSKLTTATDAVQLSYQAKVTSLGSLVTLDRSAMVVASGAALNMAGGSLLRVTGDLFSLTNGSTLSILSGPLVSLSAGSILSVNGALIGFGGTGRNVVSVANSLCPCTTIGGVPVSLTGGAVASNVAINGAIKSGSLGSLNLTPNAAVIRVDGAATKVTINGM